MPSSCTAVLKLKEYFLCTMYILEGMPLNYLKIFINVGYETIFTYFPVFVEVRG